MKRHHVQDAYRPRQLASIQHLFSKEVLERSKHHHALELSYRESPVGLDERIRTLEGLIASIATATPGRLDGLLPAEELRQIQLAAGTSPGYTSKDENPVNGLLMLGGDPIYDSMRWYEAGPSQPPSTMRSGLPSWVGQNHTELPFNIPPLPLPSTCLPNPSPRDLRYR